MAYFSFLRRSVVHLLLSSSLVACTADSLVPPASVDNNMRVGAIQPRRVEPAAAPQYAYPTNAAPVQAASVDYLDTPNLAGVAPAGGSQSAAPRLAMAGTSRAPAEAGLTSAVPSEGINMDAELGVDSQQVVGLAQEEAGDIAEGASDQPVVDGIGSDNPVQSNRVALPRPAAQAQLRQTPIPRVGQQVAMLPRVENPMVMPEPVPQMQPQPQPDVMPASELQCRRELRQLGVVYEDKLPISNGPACQVPYPVSLNGLSGRHQRRPAVTLNCQVTLAFAKWVKNELAPLGAPALLVGHRHDHSAGRLFLPPDEQQLAALQPDVGARPWQRHRRRHLRFEERARHRRPQEGSVFVPRRCASEGSALRQLPLFRHGARPGKQSGTLEPLPFRSQGTQRRPPLLQHVS